MVHFLERCVRLCVNRPWLIIGATFAIAAFAAYYATAHFAIDTNTAQLISPKVAWRADEIAYSKAFPQLEDAIVAVIDAPTAEQAETAANALQTALIGRPHIVRAWRPDSNAYLQREGLLLLDQASLRQTLAEMSGQKDFLAGLAGDPSLRGLMRLFGRAMVAAGSNNQAAFEPLIAPLGEISNVIDARLADRPALLSWRSLFDPVAAAKSSFRRLVLIQPVLDFSALEPGGRAIAQVRLAAKAIGANQTGLQANGVSLRLTGPTPLADEEFATVAENYEINIFLTLLAVACVLFVALRSPKIIFAVLLTLIVGLAITSGLGLFLLERLNLISVAFAVLFIGLGVDFGIQFATRYREERFVNHDLKGALVGAIGGIGYSLTLAAISLVAGFFCFLPTEFRGVSELGFIAGLGMIIAFVVTITFLPAMLVVLKPGLEKTPLSSTSLSGVDYWIEHHRAFVLGATALVVLAGLPALAKLRFDSNPMHLRSAKVESVSTYLDLSRDPETAPNTISVLAPSLEEAPALMAKLAALPSVAQAVGLPTFVPADQDEKLTAIRETASAMSHVFEAKAAPAPTDAENLKALDDTYDMLAIAVRRDAPPPMARFTQSVAALMRASPEKRASVQAGLFQTFPMLIEDMRLALAAQKTTIADIPADMRRDWIAVDGSARIEVFPRGDSTDNAVLANFASDVRSVAPHATGAPIAIVEAGKTIVKAFLQAGVLAFIAIFGILYIAMRSVKDVALALGPLLLAGVLSLEAAQLLGMSLDYANIIALPLMFGVGVAFHIYYLIAWRDGMTDMLGSSLTRAIFFSSLTTGIAFGSLYFSSHPGTAGMGQLLAISLFFTLLAAFIIVPAFLGPPPVNRRIGDG